MSLDIAIFLGYTHGSCGQIRTILDFSTGIHIVSIFGIAYLPLTCDRLGQAAIFLIGGTTRDEKGIPIILRSGDVLIMSGPQCRRAYHGICARTIQGTKVDQFSGVPRILEGSLPSHLKEISEDDEAWSLISEYLETSRININVRQVFPPGFPYEEHNLGHLVR